MKNRLYDLMFNTGFQRHVKKPHPSKTVFSNPNDLSILNKNKSKDSKKNEMA